MATARELYPENHYICDALYCTGGEGHRDDTSFHNYQPIIESFGPILVQVDQNDYQGDSYVVYGNSWDAPIRYLVFGWGSCSGCDALQGCNSYEEVDRLIDSMRLKIRDFASVSAFRDYYRQSMSGYEWYVDTFTDKFLPAMGFSFEEIMEMKSNDNM